MWAFLKTVRNNPIYLREQGRWGEPNQYYATLLRYLPLIILVVIALGVCGYGQAFGVVGLSDEAGILFALICIPNILLQMLTWVGLIIAPALTAPSVVEEVHRGSWDILRLTPMPTMHVIAAKFLGSLSRLKIWRALLIISVIYAAGTGIGSSAFLFEQTGVGSIFWGLLSAIMIFFRPWLEIGFAGLAGLTLSLWTSSTRAALIGSYALVIFFRLVLGNAVMWSTIGGMMALDFEEAAFATGSMSLVVLYLLSNLTLFFLMRRRALALDNGDFLKA
ncbi:MAG: hypothetical protein AB8G95_06515 [Anaerolineae bacterium]